MASHAICCGDGKTGQDYGVRDLAGTIPAARHPQPDTDTCTGIAGYPPPTYRHTHTRTHTLHVPALAPPRRYWTHASPHCVVMRSVLVASQGLRRHKPHSSETTDTSASATAPSTLRPRYPPGCGGPSLATFESPPRSPDSTVSRSRSVDRQSSKGYGTHTRCSAQATSTHTHSGSSSMYRCTSMNELRYEAHSCHKLHGTPTAPFS